ncbi:MAG: DUF3047 domain-containing protein [Rhodospirillales bacterium]
MRQISRSSSCRLRSAILCIGLIALLGACDAGIRQYAASPEGDIDFLTEDAAGRFTAGAEIRRRSGFFDSGLEGISFVRVDGRPAVRLSTPGNGGVIGLLTNQPLLATPYAAWQWRLTSTLGEADWLAMRNRGETDHPARVLIGFRLNGSGSNITPGYLGDELPPHDRAITIVWSTLSSPPGRIDRRGPYGRLTLRQGVGGFDQWQEENIDLSNIYREIWPEDNLSQVNIAFLAVATRASGLVTESVIDGLRVYR